MFYEAVGVDFRRSIGLAVSKDGLSDWKRFGRPILAASEGGWDSGDVGTPCPVAMAGRLLYPKPQKAQNPKLQTLNPEPPNGFFFGQ